MTCSTAIDEAIALAEAARNSIREVSTGWSEMREVVYMSAPLDGLLQKRIAADTQLRFFNFEGTPHDAPECGFVDDREKVTISFPI